MTLKKAFGAGQLPDKFKHAGKVAADFIAAEWVPPPTIALHPYEHATVLLRIVETLVKPGDAFSWQVLTLRAAMAAHGTCPDCGGHVHVDTTAEVLTQDGDERETSRRAAPVAFCSGCEFAMEMPAQEAR